MKNRIPFLDISRGIAILMVVIYHVSTISFITNWFGQFQLFVFFLISGCLFRNQTIKEFALSKTKHVLVPYFIWGIITLVYFCLIENRFRHLDLSWQQCLIGLVTGIEHFLDFNSPLWFVFCFIAVCVIYYFLNKILYLTFSFNKHSFWIVNILKISIILLWLVLFTVFKVKIQVCSFHKVPSFMIAYFVGDFLTKTNIISKIKIINKWIKLPISIFLIVSSAFCSLLPALNILTIVFGVFGVVLFSMIFDEIFVIEIIGKASFLIMFIHGPIYRVLTYLLSLMLNNNQEELRKNIFFIIFISLISVALCLIINQIIILVKKRIFLKAKPSV